MSPTAAVSLLMTSWLALGVREVTAQIHDCPLGWVTFNDHCYHFVFYPTQTLEAAVAVCEQDAGYLLSINTEAEHLFISEWLTKQELDRSRRWWTSGIGAGTTLRWEGDGTALTFDTSSKWGEADADKKANLHIVYTFTIATNTFLWNRQPDSEKSPFICEVNRQESFRVTQAQRDFTYGTLYSDVALAPRGPRFTILPESVVVADRVDSTYLECEADSLPPPSYTWYKRTSTSIIRISSDVDPRYTLTNGRLSLQDPQTPADAGLYYCAAENEFGSINTPAVRVSFGYIGDFSNDPPGSVRAKRYQGTVINCNPPRYNPDASFQWFKGPGANFLRTDLNKYLFMSFNGKLYFSETSLADAGMYHCVVTLTVPPGQRFATVQPPSKTSLGIELIVEGDVATDFGPEIHNDFPAVFPTVPLRGQQLRVECLAYGSLPLYYTWSRDNGPVPDKAWYLEDNRVLILPDVQLEDAGNYTCNVQRKSSTSHAKSISLVIEAAPFFMFPLRDQHVDIDSQVSIRCHAGGVPAPTYAWQKNGQPLTSTPGDVEVSGNVVVIKRVDPARHSGMYECSATNLHGTSVSSAQLRVLSFAPTFSKRPLADTMTATIGGNATIICQPDASPSPEMTWSLNDAPLNLVKGAEGRVVLLDNGNLFITQVQMSDQGRYTCTAENLNGRASSTGLLSVVSRTTITVPPRDTHVDVNGSAFLQCQASFDRKQRDLVYVWSFNDVTIDADKDPTFKQSTSDDQLGLYIINTQFEHAGEYRCTALTVDDSVTASAYLTVQGPPSEPAGVLGQVVNGMSVVLIWSVGDSHGADILFFNIEYKSNFNPVWRYKYTQLRTADTLSAEHPDKHTYVVTDLSPGSSYSFRVSAINRYGVGPPSQPSAYLKIPDAAPTKAPEEISIMYSTVGTLAFTWQELSEEDLTGDGVGYKVFWRKKTNNDNGGLWQREVLYGRTDRHVALVGQDNFYLEYEVKVGAFNSLGDGPNSTIFIIMSAEDLPIETPRNVRTGEYNATAFQVFWNKVDTSRQAMRGKLVGFQVNYWWEPEPGTLYSSNVWCDDCEETMVIGVIPNENYWINVQVFNTVGLGPKGEDTFISLLLNPPLLYPEYVMVSSHGPDSVFVQWRGVSIGLLEEPLIGYKMRWWPATENILTANDTVVYKRQTSGVIVGIKENTVYALRVLGFNRGGDGKKSPTVYFTREGMVVYNPQTTDIMAGASHTTVSTWTIALTCLTTWLVLQSESL
ncbi:contactin-like isoform X2 [Pomacea canaliculata]|nr:contactin-like isoform X2 [Pomacea canaliculata]